MTVRKWIILLVLSAAAVTSAHSAESDPFPRPAGLEEDIAFWRTIFGVVGSDQALLHDNRYLGVVYETVDIPAKASPRTRRKIADRSRDRYRKIVKTLASGKRSGLSAEESRVLGLWPADVSNEELRAAERRIRFQQGLADRYLEGLVRSGRWKPYIKQQLVDKGVPTGLSALPHVESSFNPEARSHVGAAGLWQFTRSTGRRFMEIDHVVDERRDPYRSSEAAAELLAYNYSILDSWPLAITAYNHGVAGMRRAVRKAGTDDFTTINREYKGRTFGFASRNFYLAFLAALDVEQNADRYFGSFVKDQPGNEMIIAVPNYIPADTLAEAVGVSSATLKKYNPALLSPIWSGTKHVPRGYQLRVPVSLVDITADEMMAAVPVGQRFANQTPDMYHKIRRGESLSEIAARYNTSVTRLMDLNNLRSRHRIRAGQTLTLPYAGISIPAGAETYTVRRGDSVGKIASRAGVSESSLMQMNTLRNKNRIYEGQVLYLRPPAGAPAQEQNTVAAQTPAQTPAQIPAQVVSAEPESAPVEAAEAVQISRQIVQQKARPIAEVEEPAPAVEASVSEADEAIGGVVAVTAPDVPAESLAQARPPVEAALADPNDYSVADNRTIEVQAAETLGHYADWLEIKTQRLRDINRMSFSKPVVVGRRVELDFSRVNSEEFINRRILYHRDMQEAFFTNYRVVDTTEHKLKRGESVWLLTHRNYKVPVWLLRQYNPDLDFGAVRPGVRIVFPRIERVEQEARNLESVADAS